jgi:hypothetical protein
MRQWLIGTIAVAVGLAGCHGNEGGSDMSAALDMSAPEACSGWPQWGQSPDHAGSVCVAGQAPAHILATVEVDPFGVDETADDGDLLVHYQVPLVVDDDVYVLQKGGSFTAPCPNPDAGAEAGCYSWDSQTWSESHFSWSGGKLKRQWSFASDWKPVPSEVASAEQLFQPAIAGGFIYVPGLGGSVHKVDRKSGKEAALLSPFGATLDPDTYVSGPLVADAAGNVFYNVIKFDHAQPLFNDVTAWLVKIAADDTVKSVTYDSIVTNAPTGKNCHGTFFSAVPVPDLPWPPPNDANNKPVLPPLVNCGKQRPGINVAPAVGKDGSVFTVSRAHFDSQDSFVLAVNADLTPKWTTSLRGILNDACGVNVPSDGDTMNNRYDCRPGTTMGVDRQTNQKPAARVIDESSSSPVALPDGTVLYGAYTSYNDDRGHLIKLDPSGTPIGTYDFGWDYTPAVWQHDGTYSLVVKDNHYIYDSMGVPQGPYYLTQLDKDLNVEWHFQNLNTQSCHFGDGGAPECVIDHPHGFEWCINAPAIDSSGTIYAGGEDGVVYAIGQGGLLKGSLFIGMSLGASYTPLAIDRLGRLYTQNDGKMQVLGK